MNPGDKTYSEECYGKGELNLLLEFSDLLSNREINLNQVISLLGEHLHAHHIILAILNRKNDTIFVEGTYGFKPQAEQAEQPAISYSLGEGVIGSVVQSGRSVLIPKISESCEFLNRMHAPVTVNGEDVSFICVPIRYKNETIGSLSFHKVYGRKRLFNEDVRLLRIIGSMIGRAVRRRQEYAEELEELRRENLIESELFGHEKGAFTGAVAQRIGRFEAANKGSIFLDEFGEIPLSTQLKLLRVIQQREMERVGGSKTVKVDVRIICATNRNLEKLIIDGSFREDLYYRINVFPVFVPP